MTHPLWWQSAHAGIRLASQSPRRLELLQQVGITPQVTPVDCDETPHPGEDPAHYVERLAREKAQAGLNQPGQARMVIGSDTAVVIDNEPLGKPVDRADAKAMLQRLVGRSHEVMTGIAVVTHTQSYSQVVTTRVTMRPASEDELDAYLATGESMDKAGAYAIQGMGAFLVEHIEGSYSAVVGLPIVETLALLNQMDRTP
uniref:dTTP/UTP pyrophosphatase n=1 Tax=Magnetococcus massalia (strain MO-1) TaxID=451514 RepID=A0A1S7LM33_MAGMO|nr:Maf-like protein [Candidatus Magnetococcus massalia]